MSQYQQIRVRVEPVYKDGLGKAFPRLHALLSQEDNRLIKESPPLYDLVPLLVALSQRQDLPDHLGETIYRLGQPIVQIRLKAEEALSGWRLSAAEKLLNDLEDAFAALEQALPPV
ncbi:MAG: hypothetical protein HY794_04905 [Desulfarculus sp.]|nr:hypothetical protein [Desulfarculus sp.]